MLDPDHSPSHTSSPGPPGETTGDEMDWQQFAQQMASMARGLLAQPSVDATLTRITYSARDLVEGCDAAGILILHGRQAQTLAPTEDMAVECDQLQARLGEGPCFDAVHHSEGERVFRIPDLTRHASRWPRFAPAAHRRGWGA
jgi:hypothetical protein